MFKKKQPPVMRTKLWLTMELQHQNFINTPPLPRDKVLVEKLMQGKAERPENELLALINKMSGQDRVWKIGKFFQRMLAALKIRNEKFTPANARAKGKTEAAFRSLQEFEQSHKP